MKKIVCLMLVCLLLTGCTSIDWTNIEGFTEIEGSLYYNNDTKIIYYIVSCVNGEQGFGYMSPYYSNNGKICKYVSHKIVEIN